MKPRKAFTLIELLVVIAIIGALIAITVPALSKARQRARNVQCTTNVRSISRAFNVYIDLCGREKGYFGYIIYGGIPRRMAVCPETQIVPIAKPSGPHGGSAFSTWAVPTSPAGDYFYGSYGGNEYWTLEAEAMTRTSPNSGVVQVVYAGFYHRNRAIDESTIPAFADGATYALAPDEANTIPLTQLYTNWAQLGAMAMRRHGSRTNVAFADAHVEGVKLEDLWTLRWKSNWKRVDPYPIPATWNGIDGS
jgi:prepilin-type N-terminal cleavage/methylation domain-containing protein/prepilin-type processing-associated H-X9-DG protein